jgi:hypothetical protein
MLPTVAGMTGIHYYSQLFSIEVESLKLFAQAGLELQSSQILASQVMRILGMSHQQLAKKHNIFRLAMI